MTCNWVKLWIDIPRITAASLRFWAKPIYGLSYAKAKANCEAGEGVQCSYIVAAFSGAEHSATL